MTTTSTPSSDPFKSSAAEHIEKWDLKTYIIIEYSFL
jgi:hypothetical protein